MRPTPSMAQKMERRLDEGTKVPAMPRTAPRMRPMMASVFRGFFIWRDIT